MADEETGIFFGLICEKSYITNTNPLCHNAKLYFARGDFLFCLRFNIFFYVLLQPCFGTSLIPPSANNSSLSTSTTWWDLFFFIFLVYFQKILFPLRWKPGYWHLSPVSDDTLRQVSASLSLWDLLVVAFQTGPTNGAFLYTLQLRFPKLLTLCVTRRDPLSWNFRSETRRNLDNAVFAIQCGRLHYQLWVETVHCAVF